MSFNVTFNGWDEFNRRIDPEKRKSALYKTMQQVTLMIAGYISKEELAGQVLKVQTGRLRQSITGVASVEGNKVIGRIGTNVKYARIHELGGVIRATNAPYLKFKVNGKWVQKKEVTIPARPFMRPALENNEARIVRMFQKTIDILLSGGDV